MSQPKMIALRPISPGDLRDMIVGARGGLALFPRTRLALAPDERVLVDAQLWSRRILWWARARYSQPEGRGPVLVSSVADRAAVEFLLVAAPGVADRARVRFPTDVAVMACAERGRLMRGRLLDLSYASARLSLPLRLPLGASVALELPERPPECPPKLKAVVTQSRSDGIVVHFGPGEDAGWQGLRRFLRRSEERGRAPLGAP